MLGGRVCVCFGGSVIGFRSICANHARNRTSGFFSRSCCSAGITPGVDIAGAFASIRLPSLWFILVVFIGDGMLLTFPCPSWKCR